MPKYSSCLGVTILNPNLKFECCNAKLLFNALFIITKQHEVLVYFSYPTLILKYIIISSMQSRPPIIDLFLIKQQTSLLSNDQHIVIVISKPLVIAYHSFDDGLCLQRINLSSFIINDTLIKIFCVNDRFLLIILTKKAILFDCYTQLVIKEEIFKYLSKQQQQSDVFNKDKDNKESIYYKKEDYFEVQFVYEVKDNAFYLLSKANDTFFLSLPKINDLNPYCIDYSITRIRIVKQSFQIDRWIQPNTPLASIYHDEFLLYYNNNMQIVISFLDSVEELTRLSAYTSKEKYPIVYLNSLIIDNKEYFIAVHQDLICELFSYVKTIREIRLEKRYKLANDDISSIQFIANDNILIAFSENNLTIFNLSKINNDNELLIVSQRQSICLRNIFNTTENTLSLFFTKYFQMNFSNYLIEVTKQLTPQFNSESEIGINSNTITASVLFAYSENKSIYYIIGTNTGKIVIFDTFFTETFLLNPLILIDYHKTSIISLIIFDNRILIAASNDGMISFTDICTQKLEAAINRKEKQGFDYINNSSIAQPIQPLKDQYANFSCSIEKKRSDSLELFTKQFNYSFIRKQSLHNKKADTDIELITVNLTPFKKIKNYSRLTRICKVIELDSLIPQSKTYLGYEFEDKSMLIMKMDTYELIYRYYYSEFQCSIKGVYLRQSNNTLIFYLSTNIIKVASYLTRSIDRLISDPETMYSILNTDEMLSNFFTNHTDINAYVKHSSISSMKYKEPEDKPKRRRQSQKANNIQVTLDSIEDYVTNESLKELFIMKYYQNLSLHKQTLNTSTIRQESHSGLIDDIIQVITNTSTNDNDSIKKIEIMNIIYNQQYFVNLQQEDTTVCMKNKSCTGVISNLINFGHQYTQCVIFDYEKYFAFIENVIKTQENIDSSIFRTNYFNWISLFNIWNFSIELDTFLYQKFKLVQPIFEFNPILIGEGNACSILFPNDQSSELNDKTQVRLKKFNKHFDYFLNYINVSYSNQKKNESNSILRQSITTIKSSIKGDHQSKRDFFLNKSSLLENYQSFLVNLSHYQLSTNTSHHMNMLLLGSLIASLGYQMNTELSEFIDSEEKTMKILASKGLIKYCNLNMFYQFMYTEVDDLALPNNNLMLIDYLSINDNKEGVFKSLIDYISKVYMFIFDLPNENMLYASFAQLNRNLNLDSCGKMEFLSEFELSIISFLLTYNTVNQSQSQSQAQNNNKLPHSTTIKAFELLILFVFKIINTEDKGSVKLPYIKIVIELLEKSQELIEEIYKENMSVYSKLLIDFYTFSLSPINLEAVFRPFSIGSTKLIKSELNYNFIKIILAKLIKLFSKTKLNYLLKLLVEEFKKKQSQITLSSDYYTYLVELLWLLMKDRHSKIPQYLPTVANLIMITLSPVNKEFKNQCIEYSKNVLSALMSHYPMISFHSLTQKLVVGATDGKIYIYDLMTGNLWKNWVAHDSEVTAVILDVKGAMLLSYSSTDCQVKYWTVGLTNFFRNFFSMKDGYYKQKKLSEIPKAISMHITPEEKLSIVKFQIIPKKDNEIALIRENNSVEIFKI